MSSPVQFVATLEAGRVKPSDIATIQTILEAAPEISDNFALVCAQTRLYANPNKNVNENDAGVEQSRPQGSKEADGQS